MDNQVDDILARRYPSYQAPLGRARAWNRSGDPAELARAERLLAGLTDRYPHALHVWYEAVFNLVEQGRRAEAVARLAEIGRRFRGALDEDTLGLWGRCHKEAGHDHLDRGLAAPAGSTDRRAALESADGEYALAADRYRQAYRLAGNPFPGVNVATVLFLRAGLAFDRGEQEAADRLAGEARRLAGDLLAAPQWAEKLPEDDIWHRATRAEASALVGRWDEAAAWYREALARPARLAHHGASMGRQLGRVLDGYRLLGLLAQDSPPDDFTRLLQPTGA
jgi:tetratricopeptide (TPR) repeat protein